MKTVIIVQARMGSTRLPGKAMLEVAGETLLGLLLKRLRLVSQADAVVVATTTAGRDLSIVDQVQGLGLPVWRGSEEDVLARYHGAAMAHRADVVVRITADCPLMDPAVVDRVIGAFRQAAGACDYVSNTLDRTYPRGLDCEVFSIAALDEAFHRATDPAEREHVTPYIYRRPVRFRILQVRGDQDLSRHRWTVDTPEDFELIRRILEELLPAGTDFATGDVLRLLREHPDWEAINSRVEQKTVSREVREG